MTDVDTARHIMAQALVRMEAGRAKYGEYRPETDGRDLFQEVEDELLDMMNYAAMLVLQVRCLRGRVTAAVDALELAAAASDGTKGGAA